MLKDVVSAADLEQFKNDMTIEEEKIRIARSINVAKGTNAADLKELSEEHLAIYVFYKSILKAL